MEAAEGDRRTAAGIRRRANATKVMKQPSGPEDGGGYPDAERARPR